MLDTFNFKKFYISQDRCAMKVGTDGVLLGAWANGGKHILDIGSGTGLIALMMAQRFPSAMVEGVEIDHEAVEQSMENISASPFRSRIIVHEKALQSFMPKAEYDAIVTNPPFFVNSLVSPSAQRTVARHATTLTFEDIFSFAVNYLSEEGEISAIVPSEVKEQFVAEAFFRGLFLSRKCGIKTVSRKPIKRYLLAFSKKHSTNLLDQTEILIGNGNVRSDWYKKLTEAFYL